MRRGRQVDFNEAQKWALEALDTDVSVSAGAGSGKTGVLVERFCRLVRDELVDPREILTVTFTEKAAKEMKERIVERFRDWAIEESDKRLEQAARDMEGAYIGTIHGFAARVLRENAFAAGVDPRFSQITETEADILGERVLETLMAKNFLKGVPEYVDLALAIGRTAIHGAVVLLAGQAASLGIDIRSLEDANITIGEVRGLAGAYLELGTEIHELPLEGTDAFVRRLAMYQQIFPKARSAIEAALSGYEKNSESDYIKDFDWGSFSALVEMGKSFGAGTTEFKDALGKPAQLRAEELARALVAPLGARLAFCLRSVTADWLEVYREAKLHRGALDFNDLLANTRGLLIVPNGEPTVTARRYRERFTYVMMDEFQDTNELQASLVKAVTPPNRFFTVGDMKQSIYSFIHSDVAVFQKHHRDIEEQGGKTVAMSDNYRSRPEIIDFVNILFERLWREDDDFDFAPLTAAGTFYPDDDRPVEFIWVDGADVEEVRAKEAEAVAARIRRLLGLDGSSPMMVVKPAKHAPGPRPLDRGDIVILFKATGAIKAYERALARAGIDYYVVSGRGFFASLEVQDIVNLLRAVDNPLDDMAMAAVLRSPLVGLGEDALWWMTRTIDDQPSRHGKLFTSLSALDDIDGLGDDDREALQVFRGTLERLRGARSESRLVKFLELAIELTGYDLKLLAGENGKRRYANLRKLVDVARESATAGTAGLSEFIAYLQRMRTVAQREAEAPTEGEESSVVRLMTVHKAKGLQAPVVFVADCSRRLESPNRDSFRFDKVVGVGVKVRDDATNEMRHTPVSLEIDVRTKDADRSEAKRLFYVAATRAEERLIFCGWLKQTKSRAKVKRFREISTWDGWLKQALELQGPPSEFDAIVDVDGLRLRLLAGDDLISTSEVSAAVAGPDVLEVERRLLEAGKPLPVEAGPSPDIEAMEKVTHLSPAGPIDLTVSAVLDYHECPRKYQLRRLLGVEEPSLSMAGPSSTATKQSVDAAALGTAVHDVLAAIDWSEEPAPQMERLVQLQNTAVQTEASSLMGEFLKTSWPARFAAATTRMTEAPFSLTVEDVRLYGRMDLLFKEDGGWVVVDYKTGSRDKGRGYEHQVRMYALAVAGAVGESPRQAVLVAIGDGGDYDEEIDSAGLATTKSLLLKTARGIRAGKFECQAGDHCEHCGYHPKFCSGGANAK